MGRAVESHRPRSRTDQIADRPAGSIEVDQSSTILRGSPCILGEMPAVAPCARISPKLFRRVRSCDLMCGSRQSFVFGCVLPFSGDRAFRFVVRCETPQQLSAVRPVPDANREHRFLAVGVLVISARVRKDFVSRFRSSHRKSFEPGPPFTRGLENWRRPEPKGEEN